MESAQNQPVYDVIISGAGPVGLFLACELALAGCSVLVLEKAAAAPSRPKQLPLGLRGLNALSVEALYRRGLLAELDAPKRLALPFATPGAGPGARPQGGGHFAGLTIDPTRVDAAQWPYRLPNSTPSQLFAELAELEAVLARRAAALGVPVRYEQPITGFQQSADGVVVDTANQNFESKWLVGCDGSRSVVRKAGGFEFAGTEPRFTGYSALVDLADPEKLRPGRHVTATGMYMQAQPGYVILQDFDGGAFHQTGQPISREHVQALLRRISGTDVTITALHLASTWTDRARQATAYRRGRVLLAGDAAHIHAPLGGQGLNLGLGDALNLGWKLAATIQERAPAGLLDSYYAERYPVGARVLDWSRAQVAIMEPTPEARALRAIISDLLQTRDGATYFAGRVGGITTCYDLGGAHPLVGHSVPNFELEAGPTIGELLRDGQGVLLDFEGNSILEEVAHEFGDQLNYVAGQAKEQAGLRAVLIRPDGFVAWATAHDAPAVEELRQAAAQWFGGKK
ncbi:MAG TPA: FAD-dependent oxidoreductase [Hymenobacter sp.]|uniref:FAD-dependent oxidoreductase n=1 Tax=Hymenobacter sp. TaxID=1898978 RepID=UPI002D809A03|nr:FAD-dependent oxidoreductase [Hymenobacter sp.]HET9503180.1 FAD-dependent oxidoreductase [Hymenobacter sp.]